MAPPDPDAATGAPPGGPAREAPGLGGAAQGDQVPVGGPAGTGPAEVPPQGLRHAVRAFRNRDFAIFWTGALASNTGSWVQNLAVPYVLYQLLSLIHI